MRRRDACSSLFGWLLLTPFLASAQVDDRLLNLAANVDGASWRVFGVDADPTRPVTIAAVQEVKQQRPPSNYAVLATNRSDVLVDAYVVAALVVSSAGDVKAIQELPAIRNLKPGQTRRQETPVRAAVLSVTDRVAFMLYKVTSRGHTWTVPDADMRAAVKKVALALPVP